MQTIMNNGKIVTTAQIFIRELKKPYHHNGNKNVTFAYLTMKNSCFARFARPFFILVHFATALVLSVTINFHLLFPSRNRSYQLHSRIVRPGRTGQSFVYFAKKFVIISVIQVHTVIFFLPNFVEHYQTSKAPSSCFGAGQIFVRCENRTDFTICTA